MATVDITQDTLGQTISDNDIVLLDWWADWCGPCKQFAPTYEAASEKNPEIVFGKVDTEAEQGLAAAARNPRITPVLVPGAGHQVRRSDPQAFYRAVGTWLAEVLPVG